MESFRADGAQGGRRFRRRGRQASGPAQARNSEGSTRKPGQRLLAALTQDARGHAFDAGHYAIATEHGALRLLRAGGGAAGCACPGRALLAAGMLGLREGRSRCDIDTPAKAEALRALVEAGCVEQDGKALAMGEPVGCTFAWEREGEGLRLAVEGITDSMDVLAVGEEAMVLDATDAETPRLRACAHPALLLFAVEHGRLGLDDLAALAGRKDDPLFAAAPLPEDVVRRETPCAAQLEVHICASGDTAHACGLGARLAFRYGEVTLPMNGPDEASASAPDGRIVLVRRNRSSERKTLNAVAARGIKVWPHPFSKRDAFPLGWPVAWLAEREATWAASEPPPDTLGGWVRLAMDLQEAGAKVTWGGNLPFRVPASRGHWTAVVARAEDDPLRVDSGFCIDIDGQDTDITPDLLMLLDDEAFAAFDKQGSDNDVWPLHIGVRRGAVIGVRLVDLRPRLATLRGLLGGGGERRGGRVRSGLELAGDLAGAGCEVQPSVDLADLWRAMREHGGALDEADLTGFDGTPRDYQGDGIRWLGFLERMGWGGVLADDMGLGKTLQVLAHILAMKNARPDGVRTLVVVPTSLLDNWEREARRWTPGLAVVTLHGSGRDAEAIHGADIVLTTYGTLVRDAEVLQATPFDLICFDEAQNLRSASSQVAAVARGLRARRRLAMTGTPLENHLGELWAVVSQAMPGLLGSREDFRVRFQTPIERQGDAQALGLLQARLRPFFLRRLKSEVAAELPAKHIQTIRLDMDEDQRRLYADTKASGSESVRKALAERGLVRSGLTVLNALLRMRQACCEPALLDSSASSAKRAFLLERLDGLLAEGRQIIVVSSFAKVVGLIAEELRARGIAHAVLTGADGRDARRDAVDAFQSGQARVFLLSLKAGGAGLNLTAADTVVHYDPWWNPAAEAQATDRAHRIGQDKPVTVYRLLCKDSVEEGIDALQEKKRGLFQSVMGGCSAKAGRIDLADMAALFGEAA